MHFERLTDADDPRLPAALALLREREIDPPTGDISRRRKGFYERGGFVENPYPHIRPPYHATGSCYHP